MSRCLIAISLAFTLAAGACLPAMLGAQTAHRPAASGQYVPVKVCSLLSVAEVKKLAPWARQLDQFATAEEKAIGTLGSSCNYPTADVQVLSWRKETIDAARKVRPLETVTGVDDEAWLSNNRDEYAELYARVGRHLLTVQYIIPTGQTFASAKPTAIALAKAFAARLN